MNCFQGEAERHMVERQQAEMILNSTTLILMIASHHQIVIEIGLRVGFNAHIVLSLFKLLPCNHIPNLLDGV